MHQQHQTAQPPQQQFQQQQQPPQAPLHQHVGQPNMLPNVLPVGAVPYNGGVLFHSNLFSNSYRVPGPHGKDWIYYDSSVPMPPATHGPNGGPPTLRDQWHQQTRWLKAFIILLGVFYFLQWLVHWKG
jgi:hypothetical protein